MKLEERTFGTSCTATILKPNETIVTYYVPHFSNTYFIFKQYSRIKACLKIQRYISKEALIKCNI